MIVPRRPDARRPGPSGPDRFSPTGGSCRRAVLASKHILLSCQSISSLTASGRSGAASPMALRRTPPRLGHAHPHEELLRPALPLGRQRPPQGCSPHVPRRRRRTGGGSLLRREARRGRTLVFARWHRGGGYRLELAPRTVRALAPRSQPPKPQRFVVRFRPASAVSPHPDSRRRLRPQRAHQRSVRGGHSNGDEPSAALRGDRAAASARSDACASLLSRQPNPLSAAAPSYAAQAGTSAVRLGRCCASRYPHGLTCSTAAPTRKTVWSS